LADEGRSDPHEGEDRPLFGDGSPYAPPRSPLGAREVERDGDGGGSAQQLMAWWFVFVLNLPLPLLFGSSMMRTAGWLGMALAALVLMAAGTLACRLRRRLGQTLVVGGTLVALGQLMPVLQVVAGLFGMSAGKALGVLSPSADDLGPASITSEAGGFVVTFVTGGLLIVASLTVGLFLRLVTPRRRWGERPEPGPEGSSPQAAS
jgi:hypothetical protein